MRELLELIALDPEEIGKRYPEPALRRPAPARRRRPRARGRPAADADGRAVRGDRPDQPREPAGRVPARCRSRCARRSCSSPTTSTRRSRWATGSRSCGRAGVLAQYATPGRDPHQPGRRVRRRVRRRRPRAQAPRAGDARRGRAAAARTALSRRATAVAVHDERARCPLGACSPPAERRSGRRRGRRRSSGSRRSS